MEKIKTFESFVNVKVNIPDELAIWCLDYYSSKQLQIYNYHNIPKDILKESKKLLKKYSDGYLYRGLKKDSQEIGISWTFDKDTAIAFSNKYKEPIIARIKINKLKYIISMDIIMENITSEQLKEYDNDFYYISESEVLVFDNLKSNLKYV